MVRSFVLIGAGFLLGGVIGAYATSIVYGEREPPPPPPPTPVCTACPVCPPPSEVRLVVPETDPDEMPEAIDVPEVTRPGLPASAIRLASAAFQRAIEPCVKQASAGGAAGAMLIDLTVTATSGLGHIREARVIKKDADVAAAETCILEAAQKVQFDWPSADGESRLRYPLEIGASN